MIFVVLATLCLAAGLFMIPSTRSNSTRVYNPFLDLNEDGTVDIFDAIMLANGFGTSGTPISKAGLLENLTEPAMIRYYDPMEYNITQDEARVFKYTATFQWTPRDATNNAIVSIFYYLEARAGAPTAPGSGLMLLCGFEVAGPDGTSFVVGGGNFAATYDEWAYVSSDAYQWFEFQHKIGRGPHYPVNQAYYNLTMAFTEDTGGSLGTLFVRNINIVMTVVDGLPASNYATYP